MNNFVRVCAVFCMTMVLCTRVQASAPTPENNQPPLRIAVASNFVPALQRLLPAFQQQTGISTQVISAATGTLYQQAKHGAPFDLLMAADTLRPEKLEQELLITKGSRKSYAFGQLAFWSANKTISSLEQIQPLPKYFAIANPEIAPYGKAAKQALTSLSLWPLVEPRLITGINISQTFQQLRSQAVPIGIVAYSQLVINGLQGWLIPSQHYQPIEQQLVILKSSKQQKNAEKFSAFIRQTASQQQLAQLGYFPLPPAIDNKGR